MIEIKHRWTGEVLMTVSRANLNEATLNGANLNGANLNGATLYRANLYGATLNGATLNGANLNGATLDGATLYRATLYGATLYRATLPDGTPYREYLRVHVIELLQAGGKSIEDLLEASAWDCHEWTNCPMAFAFSVHAIGQVPWLYRQRAEFFVTLFDARLIPAPRQLEDGSWTCLPAEEPAEVAP